VSSSKLIINTQKTKSIVFSYKVKNIENQINTLSFFCHKFLCSYSCNCQRLEIVEKIKYLGLIIDRSLKWNFHIDFLASKLRAINRNLYYMRQFLKDEQLKALYLAWFESSLRYGIIHWGGTYTSLLKPVIIAQKMALRTVFGVKKYDTTVPLFNMINVLNLSELYLLSIFKYFKSYFHLFPLETNLRSTRSTSSIQLHVPNLIKQTSRNQFHYNSISLFNKFSKPIDLNVGNK